jgi:RNA polymerase primary sigma factor
MLRKRFGTDIKSELTQDELLKQFDITRERLREIEEKALRKLRKKKEDPENDDNPDDGA